MKTAMILGTTLMALTNLAQSASFPEGTFRGEGEWKSSKLSGTYIYILWQPAC